MIKITERCVCGILVILIVLVTIGSCAAMPPAGDVSESDRNSSSATIYVPDDYPTIQSAVNAAYSGDTIIVGSGAYKENVIMDKKLTLIGDAFTTIDAQEKGDVINISADYCVVTGFRCVNATKSRCAGIKVDSDWNRIENNTCENNNYGICLNDSSNNMISNNTVLNNKYGISLHHPPSPGIVEVRVNVPEYVEEKETFDVTIDVEGITDFNSGMFDLTFDHKVVKVDDVTDGSIDDTEIPVAMWDDMDSDTIRVMLELPETTTASGSGYLAVITFKVKGDEGEESALEIANGDLVKYVFEDERATLEAIEVNWNGAVVKIGKEEGEGEKGEEEEAGTRVGSHNNLISNNNILNSRYGIYLAYSTNNTLMNNIVSSNNKEGFYLIYSSNNTIKNNEVRENNNDCIYLRRSVNNEIKGNKIHENKRYGIHMSDCSNNNTIVNNEISDNRRDGIYLDYSTNNIITSNEIYNNKVYGIYLRNSGNSTLTNNIISGSDHNFAVYGELLHDYIQNIDASNKVEGKPVYYLVNKKNQQIPTAAGYVGIVNSTNVTVKDLTLTNNSQGVLIAFSKDLMIENVKASNNKYGIYLDSSSNNVLMNNKVSNNDDDGIYLRLSVSNEIKENKIHENKDNGICVYDSSNNNMIQNNEVHENNDDGIYLRLSVSNKIKENKIHENKDNGICVYDSSNNNVIKNNEVRKNDDDGIHLQHSSNTDIVENEIHENKDDGIHVYDSKNGRIASNKIYNNSDKGIYLKVSNNNTIINNKMELNGLFVSHSCNNSVDKNTVNGKPLVYLEGIADYSVTNAGQVIAVNCNKITVADQNLSYASVGIEFWSTNNSLIVNNRVSNNYDGIYLIGSVNNEIKNNEIRENMDDGIHLERSTNAEIKDNKIHENRDNGICAYDASNNNTIQNNEVRENDDDGIYLKRSTNNDIGDNKIHENKKDGIFLSDSSNNTIQNNEVSKNDDDGIHLQHSSNTDIVENEIYENKDDGLDLYDSTNNDIEDNEIHENKDDGICVYDSSNNTMQNNEICENKDDGIQVYDSKNGRIASNKIYNNSDNGIYLKDSNNNTIINNKMELNGLFVSHSCNNSVDKNTVNGKPLVYLEGIADYSVTNAGQVIAVNCNKITVADQNLSYASVGIEFWSTNNSLIVNNRVSNNYDGIYLIGSVNNEIKNNEIRENMDDGIHLERSTNTEIRDNEIHENRDKGISVLHLHSSNITNNNCSNNKYGIHLGKSNNNSISENSCTNGIFCWSSRNNNLTGNVMVKNGIHIGWNSLSDYTHEIAESNTVNGKPVYYWNDVKGGKIPDGAGQVILVNCSNVTVENQNLNNASMGIEVAFSSSISIKNNNNLNNIFGIYLKYSNNSSISNNNCSNSGDGIRFYESNNNCMSNNNCSNNRYGIRFYKSNNNIIYLNNFINNTDNVHSYGSTNLWKSKEKISYTYNETTYTNYLGNHWSDYNGTDTDKDGIGDILYSINTDKDNYPLMQPWQDYFPEENEAKENKNQKLAFSTYYQPINISVNHSVPPYQLPLNLSIISNIEDITKLRLNETEEELLETNGFVILDYGQEDDIVAPYKDMKDMGIPIFVTSDTLLHLYHIQFNEILKGIEEREFFDALADMSKAMLNQSVKDHENFDDPELKESARRNVAYFAVALKLLQTPTEGYNGTENIKVINFSIPEYVIEDVNKELENITQHDGFHPSAIFNSNPNCICDYPCCYCEDYSQYVPRGHYTRSEQLKRYFNAMMWYGRIAFMLKGCSGDDALISERDANLSTMQAVLISSELPDVTVNNSTAQEIWDRIYTVTAFFVGTADDLTPYEYRDAQNIVFGTAYNASDLSDENKLLELKVELAKMRSPKIYGGSGVCVVYPPITEAKLYVCLNETKGMRFMGQRFLPDSYMFQQLVSPAVGMYTGNGTPFTMCYTEAGPARCFPRGLDIMSVLGSERAEAILIEEGDTEYAGLNTSYEKQLNELKYEFAGFNIADWNRNLYWSWLYTLKPLLATFGDGYPTFMNTKAWQNKALQTSLASWTELRHDTILYGKQSYTPSLKGMPQPPKPVVGYVEPVPEFYARLLALTEMTEKGLVDLDVLNETEKDRLHNLGLILERLMNISKAELENEALTEEDYEFIRNFGERLDYVVAGVNAKGKETTIVADVHTDCNTEMVLEEGVGYVDLILVAYIVPDGRIIVGAGPVFSYYEFKQPMDDRLTDEKWKAMLVSEPPERPGWVGGFGG